jgi:ribose transport system permease protein
MTRTDLTAPLAGSSAKPKGRGFRIPGEIGVLVALAAVVAVIGYFRPPFLDPVNLVSILEKAAFPGMLAIGMVFLLAIREIDVSMGSVFHLSAVFAALLMAAGVDPWLCALAGILVGAGLGLLNGLLVVALRLPAIIVTFATYLMLQGLAMAVGKGQPVTAPSLASSFFPTLSGKAFDVVPVVAVVFIVLALAMHVVLHRTRFGYRVQAVGSNPEAAAHAGIPVTRIRLQTLVLMGILSGLAGVTYVGAHGAIGSTDGSDFVPMAIAAAIIGGTSLSGGYGTVVGAVIGMMIVQAILSGATLLGLDAAWGPFATGAVMAFALILDRLIALRRCRRIEHADRSNSAA